ncbi:hypothetical protein [Paeniglutamicibacter cryotolerans]|uniref:Uncharacterized protein n=1 Tax=Paeniglutamicibacter cryotolerans TaxID=670079 RepID=A0A839QM15_9MICC|nr:hypothetical protein [Paeniglutamicibacter cryotolerans]MBB2994242.1 hypothetical protein [Paeniglutamicibacter cryotolerans]
MNNSSVESTEGVAKAILGPLTLRDTLAAAGALLILIGSLIPILMVGGYFSNLWMLPGGFFYPLITLVLPIVLGGAFAWRRFAGRTSLRVGSQTLDQIGSVIGMLGTGYFFFAVVATFTPAFLVALIGSLALLTATTLAPFIKPFAADFAPGQGHLLTRDVLRTAAAATETAAATVPAAEAAPSPQEEATPVAPVAEAEVVGFAPEPAPEVAAVVAVLPVADVMVGEVVPTGLHVEDDAELADIVDAPEPGNIMAPNPAIARAAAAAAAASVAAAEDPKPVARYEWPSATASAAKPVETEVDAEAAPEAAAPAEPETVTEPEPGSLVGEPMEEPIEEPAETAAAPVDEVIEAPVQAPGDEAPATSAHPIASAPAPTAAFSRIELEEKLEQAPVVAQEPEAFGATHPGDARPQAFWFAVLETRTVYNEATGAPAFEIHPGGWVLALEDRGHEFVVQDADGKLGVLRELNDIERG